LNKKMLMIFCCEISRNRVEKKEKVGERRNLRNWMRKREKQLVAKVPEIELEEAKEEKAEEAKLKAEEAKLKAEEVRKRIAHLMIRNSTGVVKGGISQKKMKIAKIIWGCINFVTSILLFYKKIELREDHALYCNFLKQSIKNFIIRIIKFFIFILRKILDNPVKLFLHVRINSIFFFKRNYYRLRLIWIQELRWAYCHSVFFEASQLLKIKYRTKRSIFYFKKLIFSPVWISQKLYFYIFYRYIKGTRLHIRCVQAYFIFWTRFFLPFYSCLWCLHFGFKYVIFLFKYAVKCCFIDFKRTFFP